MIGRKRKRLGDLLVDAGVVTSEQQGSAQKAERTWLEAWRDID